VTPRVQLVHHLWRQQPGLYRGYAADVLTALIIGTLLILGGRDRTQAPAWDVVNANGGPLAWGMVFLVGGVLLAVLSHRSPRLMVWTLRLLAVIYLILALAFLVSVWNDPSGGGSFIGAVFAARCSFMHLSRGQAYVEGPKWTG